MSTPKITLPEGFNWTTADDEVDPLADGDDTIMLSEEQQTALSAIGEFALARAGVTMALLGPAGSGKTLVVAALIRDVLIPHKKRVVVGCSAHKALGILQARLSDFGVKSLRKPKPGRKRKDDEDHPPDDVVIADTGAGLLGLVPVTMPPDPDASPLEKAAGAVEKFEQVGRPSLDYYKPDIVIFDECSMLGQKGIRKLYDYCADKGIKILFVGDEAQLPPINDAAFPFADPTKVKSVKLTTVRRTGAGSAILALANKVRVGDEGWRDVRGEEIVLTDDPVAAFLADVRKCGVDVPETQRAVFIAYRNSHVDRMQEAACRAIYGHPAKEFRVGERVLARRTFYTAESYYEDYVGKDGETRESKFPTVDRTPLVYNEDELKIVSVDSSTVHPVLGMKAEFQRLSVPKGDTGEEVFSAWMLPASEFRNNPDHPYFVEARRLKRKSDLLSKYSKGQFIKTPEHILESLDGQRIMATNRGDIAGADAVRAEIAKVKDLEKWLPPDPEPMDWYMARTEAREEYFRWILETLVPVSHIFALTSHRAQGSTYHAVHADVEDLLSLKGGLYVGTSRASHRLIVPSAAMKSQRAA